MSKETPGSIYLTRPAMGEKDNDPNEKASDPEAPANIQDSLKVPAEE